MKIVHFPHPALRYPAQPVMLIDNEIRSIVDHMFDLMYEHKGYGLAAPQVALPYQLFVMHPKGDPNTRELERVYINPVITDKKGSCEADEGCLSFPDLYQKVRRAKSIHVQAYDRQGQLFEQDLSDLEARIVQHETDHLHGRLFIDYFSTIAKLSSRGKIAELERDYKRGQERNQLPSNKEILRQLHALAEQMAGKGKPPSGPVL
jgi:peptide deformylase